ncbi:hypothetical protein F4806DRAFT_71906 [Annulohypoxylon nitens]|nr:hypothetical protein F4806DRAFT_71906 [Annulohypoxylon nitens]
MDLTALERYRIQYRYLNLFFLLFSNVLCFYVSHGSKLCRYVFFTGIVIAIASNLVLFTFTEIVKKSSESHTIVTSTWSRLQTRFHVFAMQNRTTNILRLTDNTRDLEYLEYLAVYTGRQGEEGDFHFHFYPYCHILLHATVYGYGTFAPLSHNNPVLTPNLLLGHRIVQILRLWSVPATFFFPAK